VCSVEIKFEMRLNETTDYFTDGPDIIHSLVIMKGALEMLQFSAHLEIEIIS
jgi:hypothetical protein